MDAWKEDAVMAYHPQLVNQVKILYLEGFCTKDIASILGEKLYDVQMMVWKSGAAEERKSKVDNFIETEIRAGASMTSLRKLGIGYDRVARVCRERGIESLHGSRWKRRKPGSGQSY